MLACYCCIVFQTLSSSKKGSRHSSAILCFDASDMSGPEAAELWLKAMISDTSENGSPQTFDTTALSSLQAGHVHGMHWAVPWQWLHLNRLSIPFKAFSVYRELNSYLAGR